MIIFNDRILQSAQLSSVDFDTISPHTFVSPVPHMTNDVAQFTTKSQIHLNLRNHIIVLIITKKTLNYVTKSGLHTEWRRLGYLLTQIKPFLFGFSTVKFSSSVPISRRRWRYECTAENKKTSVRTLLCECYLHLSFVRTDIVQYVWI